MKNKTKKVASKKKTTKKTTKQSQTVVVSETDTVLMEDSQHMEEMYHIVLIQGLVTFGFGLALFLWPEVSLVVFLTLFAIMALVSGIMTVIHSIQSRKQLSHWIWTLIGGLFSIGVGLVTFAVPTLTGVTLLFIVAVWAIVWGIVKIIMAFKMKEFLYSIAGIIAIIFGIFLFKNPGTGVIAAIQIISFFGMVLGTILTVLALKFRHEGKKLEAK